MWAERRIVNVKMAVHIVTTGLQRVNILLKQLKEQGSSSETNSCSAIQKFPYVSLLTTACPCPCLETDDNVLRSTVSHPASLRSILVSPSSYLRFVIQAIILLQVFPAKPRNYSSFPCVPHFPILCYHTISYTIEILQVPLM